jgi:hypothetical protein
VVEKRGIPLAIRHSAANVHDIYMFEERMDAIPSLRQKKGCARRRPGRLHANKAYDAAWRRQAMRRRNIT